jgi:hypothetical protein
MPIKAGYLLLAGGGGVFVWSGIAGKSVSGVFRQLVGGDTPTNAANANQIAADASLSANPSLGIGGATTPAGTSPANSAPTASETAWFTALLTAIGAPVTQANLQALSNWAHLEEPGWTGADEGGTTNNPLNHGAAPGFSSSGETDAGPGIPHYATVGEGVAATAAYLKMGNYSGILASLRSGNGISGGTTSQELSLWSGGGYSSV